MSSKSAIFHFLTKFFEKKALFFMRKTQKEKNDPKGKRRAPETKKRKRN